MPFDFAIHDLDDHLVAVLEAKAQRGMSVGWATNFRRNLLAHFGSPSADFFGVVTPDTLFLWRRGAEGQFGETPDFVIDLSDAFGSLPDRVLRGYAFELVVSSWLSRLTSSERNGANPLEETGLPEAIRNGRMTIEAAA